MDVINCQQRNFNPATGCYWPDVFDELAQHPTIQKIMVKYDCWNAWFLNVTHDRCGGFLLGQFLIH